MNKDIEKMDKILDYFLNFFKILVITLGAILNIELGKQILNTTVTKTTSSQHTIQLTEPIQ